MRRFPEPVYPVCRKAAGRNSLPTQSIPWDSLVRPFRQSLSGNRWGCLPDKDGTDSDTAFQGYSPEIASSKFLRALSLAGRISARSETTDLSAENSLGFINNR